MPFVQLLHPEDSKHVIYSSTKPPEADEFLEIVSAMHHEGDHLIFRMCSRGDE